MTRVRRSTTTTSAARQFESQRHGKILVLLVIMLPTLCGLIGLAVDGGLLLSNSRQLQHAADAAATAAAWEKQQGQANAEALAVAEQFVRVHNSFPDATVALNCPPANGPYAGSPTHVELIVEDQSRTYFIQVLGGVGARQIQVRSVAGYEPATSHAAIVVLDPNPPPFDVSPLPALPIATSLPAITGGLEVLGAGTAQIHGAVQVNTEWGGVDQNGDPIGEPSGPSNLSHAVSCTPLISLTKLRATDIRVVGGVDDPNNYGAINSGEPSSLKAGRLPVPDPFKSLPAPMLAVDSSNITTTDYGGRLIVGLPLIGPSVTLQPGIYDWIEVVSGIVTFQPGVYIIRGVRPTTQLALNIVAGQVRADGVMFYITDSTAYTPTSGLPDANDGETTAPIPGSSNTPPCAFINIGLLSSSYSGLDDPSSPFHRLFLYQRRHDRRPIILLQENLLGAGQLRGTIYSKWGHVVLAGMGTYDARIVAGTMRLIALVDMQIQPTALLPPAEDVYLVE